MKCCLISEEDNHEPVEKPVPLSTIHDDENNEAKNLTLEGNDNKSRRYIENEKRMRERETNNDENDDENEEEFNEDDLPEDDESELSNISD